MGQAFNRHINHPSLQQVRSKSPVSLVNTRKNLWEEINSLNKRSGLVSQALIITLNSSKKTARSLSACAHVVGPGEAQTWIQEAKGQNLRIISKTSSRKPRKSLPNSNWTLQTIPWVLPAHTDWPIIQTCKQKKDESVADFSVCLKALFLWLSWYHTINRVSQPPLVALLVNGLSSEISRKWDGRPQAWPN